MRKWDFVSLKQVLAASTSFLSAKTEGLDDGTIAVYVAVVQIVEQSTAFSYQLGQ